MDLGRQRTIKMLIKVSYPHFVLQLNRPMAQTRQTSQPACKPRNEIPQISHDQLHHCNLTPLRRTLVCVTKSLSHSQRSFMVAMATDPTTVTLLSIIPTTGLVPSTVAAPDGRPSHTTRQRPMMAIGTVRVQSLAGRILSRAPRALAPAQTQVLDMTSRLQSLVVSTVYCTGLVAGFQALY
jgi:hypothetical protein